MFDPDELENPSPAPGTVADAILAEGAFALELGALKRHAGMCEEAGWTPGDVALVAECARQNGKRRLETVFATMQRERSWTFVLDNARKWREQRKALAPGEGERQAYEPKLRNKLRSAMTHEEKVRLTLEVHAEFRPDALAEFANFMGETVDGARALLAEADVDLCWNGEIHARAW